MPRALVAGAAGFIGSHLVDRLLADGHNVVGVDNFITGERGNISHLEGCPNFEFIEADLIQPVEIKGPLDYIFHLASPASPIAYARHPFATLYAGSDITRHLLDMAHTKGSRFIITSTSEVYGDPEVHPQPESYWGNVNPIGPRSVYDESKRFAEALTMAYHRYHGVAVRIARIFNTYGPRMATNDGRVIPAFACQALQGEPLTVFGDGNQTRSFCYVADTVDGIIKLALSEGAAPCNIGNPNEMTVAALAQFFVDATGGKSTISFHPLPEDDPKRRQPIIDHARQHLNWEPVVPFSQGLELTMADFANRLGVTISK